MKESALNVQTKIANIEGNAIAYRKYGTGIPIILLNRFRGTLDTWDPLFLDEMARHNTVITIDYCGIGYSTGELPLDIKDVASNVIKFANHLDIEKFILLGWSYGGWVAQYATFLYSSRILNTVIIGSNPIGKNELPFKKEFFERALKPINDKDDIQVLFFEPGSENSKAAAESSTNRIAKRFNLNKVPSTQEIFNRYFASKTAIAEDKDNFRTAYQTTTIPILVISGDHDISFALENWYPMLGKAPTLRLIVLPESGHAPHFQYPNETSAYIKAFLGN
ncbi:alpha/beta fold hydrolase [Maribacter sp. MAR_2009_72]|uniref:alpha/beta fold hydrolase n=1 Tax=Maribacter sp. MAR_2009_72 TaxID=1250050 RepID=UPI0011994D5B|nr:alpha/beta hydrolase [Maribacter sp. MAR_2009_72]TVZ15637.1 pimeloyl-ACP methyl ester carboxylesterase [Maribacter sp. MAR_2009_72]